MTDVLHRAHHLERQSLAIGQALDAGDVEPLVRAVAAQGRAGGDAGQLAAVVGIPLVSVNEIQPEIAEVADCPLSILPMWPEQDYPLGG